MSQAWKLGFINAQQGHKVGDNPFCPVAQDKEHWDWMAGWTAKMTESIAR